MMKKPCGRKLSVLKARTQPKYMLFFDTETKHITQIDKQIHTLRLGWSCFVRRDPKTQVISRKWLMFTQAEEFIDELERRAYSKTRLFVFGHNIFFDLQVCKVFSILPKKGWQLSFHYDKGLTYILTIYKEDKTIIFLSTTNYYDYSLKMLGKDVGLEKLEVDFDDVGDDELSIYCKRDVEITVEAMLRYIEFVESHQLGSFCYTKAGQAFTAFRTKYMQHEIWLHDNKEVIELERKAYMGGRTEAFYIGRMPEQEYVLLDINSMYPYIMANYRVPTDFIELRSDADPFYINEILCKYCVVAELEVDYDEPCFATHYNNKICFPVGKRIINVCTEGFKHAYNNGYIKKVKKVAIYRAATIFDCYVRELFSLRQEYKKAGLTTWETLCKKLLNSLYGKFAQKLQQETKIEDTSEIDYFRKEIYYLNKHYTETQTKLFNTIVVKGEETEGKNSFVAISAHITEIGRLMLWNIINQVGRDRVYYCDTDSVIIRKEDLPLVKHKIDNNELGALKVEKTFTELEIRGLKDYLIDGKQKIKGVPKNARQITENRYEYWQFAGQATHLREQIAEYYIVKKIQKTLNRVYDKGFVEQNGYIKPFVFADYNL